MRFVDPSAYLKLGVALGQSGEQLGEADEAGVGRRLLSGWESGGPAARRRRPPERRLAADRCAGS